MPVIGYDPARPYVRSTERTDPLTTEIAEYLAAEAGDDMCRLYVIRAEEILAMVRESDRATASEAMSSTLKPTIINGAWVYAPPPPQDAKWLQRASANPSTPKTKAKL